MFIYTDDNIAVNINQIRALYIDRTEHAKAYTKEEHDRMDLFQLKAAMGGHIVVTISEARGIENRPNLENRMREITRKADRRIPRRR